MTFWQTLVEYWPLNWLSFFGAIEMGLIYGLVALGVYLSFRILDFPDLTVDGSFPLGAAVSASLIVAGVNPWWSILAAIAAGCIAGLITAWMNLKLNILNLLASILSMIALYSINIRVMGGAPNIALLQDPTIFSPLDEGLVIAGYLIPRYILVPAVLFILICLVKLTLDRFLNSEIGLAMRATGKNTRMARANGISVVGVTLLGMAIANGLVALSGSLFAQSQSFADITSGVGTIVVGLAAVIAGETLFSTRSIAYATLACVLGSIIYRLFMAMALNAGSLGLKASDLNLVTALLVGFALVLPQIKARMQRART